MKLLVTNLSSRTINASSETHDMSRPSVIRVDVALTVQPAACVQIFGGKPSPGVFKPPVKGNEFRRIQANITYYCGWREGVLVRSNWANTLVVSYYCSSMPKYSFSLYSETGRRAIVIE